MFKHKTKVPKIRKTTSTKLKIHIHFQGSTKNSDFFTLLKPHILTTAWYRSSWVFVEVCCCLPGLPRQTGSIMHIKTVDAAHYGVFICLGV